MIRTAVIIFESYLLELLLSSLAQYFGNNTTFLIATLFLSLLAFEVVALQILVRNIVGHVIVYLYTDQPNSNPFLIHSGPCASTAAMVKHH